MSGRINQGDLYQSLRTEKDSRVTETVPAGHYHPVLPLTGKWSASVNPERGRNPESTPQAGVRTWGEALQVMGKLAAQGGQARAADQHYMDTEI